MIHLKLALRALVHYRMYSLINLAGLVLSLTCVIIVARYVYSEMTVDKFIERLDRIYMTTNEQPERPGYIRFSSVNVNISGTKDADIIKSPGIEKHASFIWTRQENIEVENRTYKVQLLGIDTVFLQILNYPVKAGINNIHRPEEALITEEFAAKVFGNEDPLGKTVFYPVTRTMLTVAGIIRTPKYKSSLSFDMLVSLPCLISGGTTLSLILLYPGVDYRSINRQHSEFTEQAPWGTTYRHQLFPYGEVYFDKHIRGHSGEKVHYFAQGNLTYIFILLSIGILLLLTGLTNYVNIHSVVMTQRNRELGMKKVFGAEGFKIFTQLLLENLLLIVLSLVIGFWLAEALSPFMENSLGVLQYPNLRFDLSLGLTLAVVLPIAVSIAPYLRYRYFSPVRSLQSVGVGNKSLLSRKFFLCLQYFTTMVLITVSLFFMKQLNFMLNKDLGFRTHDIIKVPFLKFYGNINYTAEESKNSAKNAINHKIAIVDEINQKLNASPLIEHFEHGGTFPIDEYNMVPLETVDGKQQNCRLMLTTEEWFKVFDVKLLEGRLWNSETDTFDGKNVIVTKSALEQLDLTYYNIIGVVSDFHTEHLSKQLIPVLFFFSKIGEYYNRPIIASFVPGRRQEVIEFMKNLHDEFVTDEFEYTFIEDEIAKMYSEDKKVAVICTAFTGMAILISMLGLLGVSLFDIRQRRKEIAIRKIHGAMMKDIVSLLLKKYFVLLGMAFVVSTPVALFVITKYLESFAYKTPVSWWLFAAAFAVTVIVSLLTLLRQAYKAGSEPPAEVVKS